LGAHCKAAANRSMNGKGFMDSQISMYGRQRLTDGGYNTAMPSGCSSSRRALLLADSESKASFPKSSVGPTGVPG
jgi:hypothetical protein